jgi:hypothetical protein
MPAGTGIERRLKKGILGAALSLIPSVVCRVLSPGGVLLDVGAGSELWRSVWKRESRNVRYTRPENANLRQHAPNCRGITMVLAAR